jgi:hypothetical protein
VQLAGDVAATQAANPANYVVIARGPDGRFGTADDVSIPIASAEYNATSQEVLLTSANRLNLHDHFELTVNLSAMSPGGDGTNQVRLFGGKQILGGFVGNHGRGTQLVPLRSHQGQVGVRAAPFTALGPLAASNGPRRGHP